MKDADVVARMVQLETVAKAAREVAAADNAGIKDPARWSMGLMQDALDDLHKTLAALKEFTQNPRRPQRHGSGVMICDDPYPNYEVVADERDRLRRRLEIAERGRDEAVNACAAMRVALKGVETQCAVALGYSDDKENDTFALRNCLLFAQEALSTTIDADVVARMETLGWL